MADLAEVMDTEAVRVNPLSIQRRKEITSLGGGSQFPLNNQRARAHDPIPVVNDNEVVAFSTLRVHPFVPLVPLLLCDVADRRQHAQAVEEASTVVVFLQRADGIAFGQGSDDGGRDESGREEAGTGVGRHFQRV